MFKKISSYILGPLIWLPAYGAIILASIAIVKIRPDNYLVIGLIVFVSAGIATYFAISIMRKLHPPMHIRTCYFIIAIFALIWLGSAIIAAIIFDRNEELIYRMISLILSQAGIALVFGMKALNE